MKMDIFLNKNGYFFEQKWIFIYQKRFECAKNRFLIRNPGIAKNRIVESI
jgi:hypothetical protein